MNVTQPISLINLDLFSQFLPFKLDQFPNHLLQWNSRKCLLFFLHWLKSTTSVSDFAALIMCKYYPFPLLHWTKFASIFSNSIKTFNFTYISDYVFHTYHFRGHAMLLASLCMHGYVCNNEHICGVHMLDDKISPPT